MKNTQLIFLLVIGLAFTPTASLADDEHENESEHEHGEEDHHEQVTIDPDIAQQAGIETAQAGSQIIHETVRLFGKTQVDPQEISHIRARYPGLVKDVTVSIGDKVKAGDLLLKIEANDSLQNYSIQSPISGTVIQRHANPGEVFHDGVLLTIADYQHLWVELDVFPQQSQQIEIGQAVTIQAGNTSAQSELSHLMSTENSGPSIIARVPLDNTNQQWTPGLMVQGLVTVNRSEVALAVENDAIQTFEGETVVFILENDHYEPRIIKTGRSDGDHTEVLNGLDLGDTYVIKNSYLIKADLEKSGAAHSH